jgi:hypothetical protein
LVGDGFSAGPNKSAEEEKSARDGTVANIIVCFTLNCRSGLSILMFSSFNNPSLAHLKIVLAPCAHFVGRFSLTFSARLAKRR